jgi:nitrogen fixation NifU-like protein
VGKSTSDALHDIRLFRDMMRGEGGPEELGDLEALQGVKKYPVRIKCAVLPWDSLEQGLTQKSGDGPVAHSHAVGD